MNVGSLFSGIGGFDLGFERAGMRTAWFVERDAYCQAVLRKHWPGVPIFDEVEEVGSHNLSAVDVLCGGFPCQDLSLAGRGAGLAGQRSGLWAEFHRIVGELRPRYVIVENVPALRARGLGRILGEMAAIGYDAEWDCIPACAVGAPHQRDRIWIVAYPQRARLEGHQRQAGQPQVSESRHRGALVADPEVQCERPGLRADQPPPEWWGRSSDGGGAAGADAGSQRRAALNGGTAGREARAGAGGRDWWAAEPDVGRVAHGVPNRVDRIRAIGNALVPQIAEWIGRRIIEWEQT